MKHYLALVPKYLAAHRKKTRLTIISVAISVALITGIFSMLDVLIEFEKIQIMHDRGNYHLAIFNASESEVRTISSRIDVQNSGAWTMLGSARLNGVACELGALDQQFAGNMNVQLLQGDYPLAPDEIMLEQWAAESHQLNLKVGDYVRLSFPDAPEREFRVSGLFYDLGVMKAQGIPGVLLSVSGAHQLQRAEKSIFLIEFKDGANIRRAEQEIKADKVQEHLPWKRKKNEIACTIAFGLLGLAKIRIRIKIVKKYAILWYPKGIPNSYFSLAFA